MAEIISSWPLVHLTKVSGQAAPLNPNKETGNTVNKRILIRVQYDTVNKLTRVKFISSDITINVK